MICCFDILISPYIIQNYIIGAFKPPCNITISFADGKNRKKVKQCLCLEYLIDIYLYQPYS